MFQRHFQDTLRGFAEKLMRPSPPATAIVLPAATLADGTALARLLDVFADAEGCRERRATASQWSKYFFSSLIIPTLVAQVAGGRALDLRLARLAMHCDENGLPLRFVFEDSPVSDRDGSDLSSLIDDALTPVVARLCSESRLAPRVFWSNAAVYYDWALNELERQRQLDPSRLAAVRSLLVAPTRADGGFNPFQRPYKPCPRGALNGNGVPANDCRRLCCMRDLDAKWGLCVNCPRAVHLPALRTANG